MDLNQMAFSIRTLYQFDYLIFFSTYDRVSSLQIIALATPVNCREQKEKLLKFPKNGEDLRGMNEVI